MSTLSIALTLSCTAGSEETAVAFTLPAGAQMVTLSIVSASPSWASLAGAGMLDWGLRTADGTPLIWQDSRLPPSQGIPLGAVDRFGAPPRLGLGGSGVSSLAGLVLVAYARASISCTLTLSVAVS